ncbi:MAG: hypothetical protein D6710_12455 [Nitrospirae bacterium]|nr:MAG: hypothetical protein D6710_12455 [Nitrospirota bacterium]
MISPEIKSFFRTLHRIGGLLVAAYVLFYAITGIMLNHRKAFGYFYKLKVDKKYIKRSDKSKIREFIEHYKSVINRKDYPTVIKIKGTDEVEFLYGSHGLVRYIIRPQKGELIRKEKVFIEPLNRLNNLLHKASKTSALWVFFSDIFSLVLIFSTITGLLILRYRKVDVLLLVGGTALLSVLAVIG